MEMDNMDVNKVKVENVRVVVRVRPLDKLELKNGSDNILKVNEMARSISITKPNHASIGPPKCFSFDNVFSETCSQIDLYVESARPIVDKVLEGYNGTILAYGQTGTGKTYTMSGFTDSPQSKGIIPNTFAHIFGHIAKATINLKFLVRVSYMEIYNEEVRDLLAKENLNKNLEVKERADIGVFVKDLSGYVVHNADDLNNIMKIGNKNRVVGETKMNVESSRSHAIFSITIESSEVDEAGIQHVKMGKLQLVDLAGSERQGKTQATGIRLKEATKINQSLSVLGNVISALVDGKSTHIPYRNSKLTRLLQDSLGGNSKTVMCATISPASSNYNETISTLRYASRAKGIQNRMHINEEPKDALLRYFQEEILELKRQLEEGLFEITSSDDLNDRANNSYDNSDIEDNIKVSLGKLGTVNKNEKSDAEKKMLEKRALENENELNKTMHEQEQIKAKLTSLEMKVLVGGENLLEKADEQEKLLENSILELELRTRTEESLKLCLQKKETERIDIKERYSSLQEATLGKTKKIHRVMQMLMSVKDELLDQQQEHQREKEAIYENIRSLSRELSLCELVLNTYVPKQYQALVKQYTHWNEDIGEWQLRCVAYTGNNMRKLITNKNIKTKEYDSSDLSDVFLCYNADSTEERVVTTSGKLRTSAVPRPSVMPKNK